MQEKVNGWLDIAERILNIFRPKAYNTIAKAVVLTGIGLIVESQVNFLHAVVVALFEEYIGKSEILRSVLNASSDPTIGILLVIVGMVYHVAVTLGKDFIETKKAELPKYPVLSCFLLNGDKEKLDSEFTLRGKLVSLPSRDSIPDQEEPKFDESIYGHHASIFRTMQAIQSSPFGDQLNKSLYRERADVLNEWAGAEILYLNISNDSRILASGVSVELTIPRHKGLSIKVPDNKYPPEPKSVRKYDDRFSHILPSYHNVSIPDLRVSSDAKNYYIKWRVNRLQAQTELEADEYVLMKTDKPIDIQCTIFCDELPEPTQTIFKANPPQGTAIVSIDELSDESCYAALRDKLIMDGYIPRVFEEMMKEYEMEEAR
ncbi:hypothetical protein [Vibrio parahaemolyticus]|uniref:hypothetical protein n=1 Tax=Vibrio parahaemolyticus TaxID=670 RepID=UPI00186A43EC|nr:hypothetical protein [Vibrio parahaemolyticus]MBE3691358.1 hypothetical protein [Vibrio parahaemolyticus]MBE3807692.1 hypothetical protein [Vibrio parahaemolyticus]WCZ02387.1 hypothetical protein GSS61_15240 [Vibrio parahaemolyticus]WPD14515.1 hypothetical protein PY372_16085 [Vibrio parahaemolyticus]